MSNHIELLRDLSNMAHAAGLIGQAQYWAMQSYLRRAERLGQPDVRVFGEVKPPARSQDD